MPQYVRTKIKGSCSFSTVVLADRSSRLLIDEIDRLRLIYQPSNNAARSKHRDLCIADHIHAFGRCRMGMPIFPPVGVISRAGFARLNPMPRSASKVGKREKGIWQRRYWEHAIRDDADLERYVDYIHFNPVKHGMLRGWSIGRTAVSTVMSSGAMRGRLGWRYEGYSGRFGE